MTDAAAAVHRPDNLLGICHRVGADLGFDPLWLRLAFAAAFVLNPVAVVAVYLALGVIVLVSRLLFPADRRSADVVTLPGLAAQVELAKAA